MFGFITRTEHDRVVAERDEAREELILANADAATDARIIADLTSKLDRLRASHRLLSAALDAKNRMLAKVHTNRGPGGRFVKREERQS